MADGVTAAMADAMLTALVTSPNGTYVALHTGAPGSAGTANQSSVTTREAQAYGSPSGGSVSATDTPTWSSWDGDNGEVLTDISKWNASSSGTFDWSEELSSSVTMDTGNTLELTADTASFTLAS